MSLPTRTTSVLSATLMLSLLLVAGDASGQPESPGTALDEALEVLQAGQVEEARSMLTEIVEQWPNFRLAHYHLGRIAFDREEWTVAGSHLRQAIEGEFPRIFMAWYYLGRTFIQEQNPEDAVAALDRAIELAPGFAPSYLERGRAQLALGARESAAEDFLSVLGDPEAPRDSRLRARRELRSLGRALEDREDLWTALDIYQRLLDQLGVLVDQLAEFLTDGANRFFATYCGFAGA